MTAAVSPSNLPQSSTGRFDVSRVDARSYRRAQPTKRALMELGPGLRARLPHQQAHRLREYPRVKRKRRVRRYLPEIGCGMDGLQLRDLRHEAGSRFDEAGVSVNYVSKILGTRT